MRQFLLGGNKPYTSANNFLEVEPGAFGVFVIENGLTTLDTDGTKVKSMANLVLGRDAKDGGPVVIPINKRGFSFVKMEYEEPTVFSGSVTIPDINNVGTYSIIIVKKGKVFNDRHKWTADTYVRDISMTPEQVAAKLAKNINDNTISNEVTAIVEGAKITITAVDSNTDFAIVPADELMGVEVEVKSIGFKGYGSADYVTDLACKAAADAGFEYTFEEDIKMYPAYPLDPLAQPKAEDSGFTIFTLNFYEGREVKQVDQVVKQIVQIAVPTGAACINTLNDIFAKIAE